jgi:hypothetical protein
MKLIYRERPPNDCFARKIKVYNEVKSEQKLKVEKKNFIFKKIVNSRLNSSFCHKKVYTIENYSDLLIIIIEKCDLYFDEKTILSLDFLT